MAARRFDWLELRPEGLYCRPADLYVDPSRAVPRAVVTHGHSDHARPGHGAVLATAETQAIMGVRMAEDRPRRQSLAFGESLAVGDATVRLEPAGHVLGSAQVVLEHRGERAVVSGDYKRQRDPTAEGFAPVRCDLFVTEATFALPVFRHPAPESEVAKLLQSLRLFPELTHILGVYGLGKCQRMLALIREAGYARPIFLHGALVALTELYQSFGFGFGDIRAVAGATKADLKGALVLAPPSTASDRWARRFGDARVAVASGWMRVRARARQRGAELPLVVSDHADWDALLRTCRETEAEEVWITHGREDALAHALGLAGQKARPLRLAGRDEDGE